MAGGRRLPPDRAGSTRGAYAIRPIVLEEEAKAVVDEVFPRSPEFNLGITRLVAPLRLIERIEQAFARLGLEIG